MTRKEDLERVKEMIRSAKEIEVRRDNDHRIAQARETANELQKKKESEAGLRATGVVDLFEKIRDKEVVRGNCGQGTYGYSLARVEVSGCKVRLEFNSFRGEYNYVEAILEDGLLVVEGKEKMIIGKNLSMADAVGRAIVNPHFFVRPEQDVDYGWD